MAKTSKRSFLTRSTLTSSGTVEWEDGTVHRVPRRLLTAYERHLLELL